MLFHAVHIVDELRTFLNDKIIRVVAHACAQYVVCRERNSRMNGMLVESVEASQGRVFIMFVFLTTDEKANFFLSRGIAREYITRIVIHDGMPVYVGINGFNCCKVVRVQ